MKKYILHIDVNNAYLSWSAIELLKNGYEIDIREIPSVIGGDESKRRGIVLAKSTIAKSFGIKTGEPIYFAKRKCPNIKIYSPEHDKYYIYSNMLFNLLEMYTDRIERYSIDECFVDMSMSVKSEEELISVAKEIKERVKNELGFTVNIGLSNNKLLAKMASDFEKPNKVHTLFKYEIQNKMWKLPISEMFFVGKKSVPKLINMNIKTIGDLANFDKIVIMSKFGKTGKIIHEYANGIDDSEVQYLKTDPKGIGHSTTFMRDLSNINEINKILLTLCEMVGFRLRKYKMLSNTVNIQIRTKDFVNYTKQRKIDVYFDNSKMIFEIAKELLTEILNGKSIRLIGIRVDNLIKSEEKQLSFFENKEVVKQEKIDKVVDNLKNKYGYEMLRKASEINLDE